MLPALLPGHERHENASNHSLDGNAPLVNPLRRPRRIMTWLLKVLAASTLVLTTLGVVVGDLVLILAPAIVGGSLCLGLGIAVLGLSRSIVRVDKELEGFQQGNYLAHWRIAAEEWRAFVVDEQERNQKTVAPVFFLAWAILGAVFMFVFFDSLGAGPALVLSIVLGGVLSGLFTALEYYRVASRNRTLASHQGVAYFGERSFYLAGTYQCWGSSWANLTAVELRDGVLEVTLSTFNGKKHQNETHRIPAPAGRENDVRRVVETWRKQIAA